MKLQCLKKKKINTIILRSSYKTAFSDAMLRSFTNDYQLLQGNRCAHLQDITSGIWIRPQQALQHGTPQTYKILKFVVGFSRWDSVLRTEGTILNPCYEIWK
jgi:hypothetical protein